MKRRIAVLILCLVMLLGSVSARAEQFGPTEEFFVRGKQALALMASGETDMALEILSFVFDVESLQTEETFRQFAEEGFLLLDASSVQLEVAVCWWDELLGVWHMGIPVVEPVSWDVEVLVLDSRDLITFSGYAASTWGALEEAVALSEYVFWNVEYLPGQTVLFADE